MSFNYIKPAPRGVDPDKREEAMAKAKPLTPKSERRRRSWGSLQMQVPSKGLCSAETRCIRRDGHDGEHWPRSNR